MTADIDKHSIASTEVISERNLFTLQGMEGADA